MANGVVGKSDRPEDVKEILDYIFEQEELKFYVSWRHRPGRFISVAGYDFVKDSDVFRQYIDDLSVNYAPDIKANREKYLESLEDEISAMKKETPVDFKDIIAESDFDEFKFKTYELMHQFLKGNVDFVVDYLEMLIINEVYLTMKHQEKKLHMYSVLIQAYDPFLNVSVENQLDWEVPALFKYKKINIRSWTFPNEGTACICENDCHNTTEKCATQCNLGLYDNKDGEFVLIDVEHTNRTIVECGAFCRCSPDCPSRITQLDDRMKSFKIFKTERSGWALKSGAVKIPKGAFIIECTGTLFKHSHVVSNQVQSYFYHFTHNDEKYVIDASTTGNIARFINHSCEPNAHIWKIIDERNNLTSTRLAVFALRDIGNDEEITVNYDKCLVGCLNKEVKCYCESASCRGFIYASIRTAVSSAEIPIAEQFKQLIVSPSSSSSSVHLKPSRLDRVTSRYNLRTSDLEVSPINHDEAPNAALVQQESSNAASSNNEASNDAISSSAQADKAALLKCPDCAYHCKTPKQMKEHRLRQHNIGKVTICSCGLIFLTRDHVKAHKNMVENKENNAKYLKIVAQKKRELGLRQYSWVHNQQLRAPKPENADYVKGYLTHYIQYLETSLKKLDYVQKKFFRDKK